MNERRSNNRHMFDVLWKRNHKTRNARKKSGQIARNWRRESASLLLASFVWEPGMGWNLFISRLDKSWDWVVPVGSCHSKLVESTQSVIFLRTVLTSFVFPFCHKASGSMLCVLTLWKLYALLCAKVPKSPCTTLSERQRENWGRDAFFSKADR